MFNKYFFYSYNYSLKNGTTGFGNGAQEATGLFNSFSISNAKQFIDDMNEKKYSSKCDSVIISFQRMSKRQYKLMESQSK